MDFRAGTDKSAPANLDVASELDAVHQNYAVGDDAIVPDVGKRHNHDVVADGGTTLFDRTAMNGRVFTDMTVGANSGVRDFPVIAEILGLAPDDSAGVDPGPGTYLCMGGDMAMRTDATSVPYRHVSVDDSIRRDRYISTELYTRVENDGIVDHIPSHTQRPSLGRGGDVVQGADAIVAFFVAIVLATVECITAVLPFD